MNIVNRFIRGIKKTDKNGCWLWLKPAGGGYGEFFDTKLCRAHRWSYQYFKKKIPPGFDVMHKCDRSACVNPDHLRLGDARGNYDDMVTKGRGNGNVRKLTDVQVRAIRARLFSHGTGSTARVFGVSKSIVRDIKRGVTYKWVK